MARVAIESFSDRDVAPVFVAENVREAKQVEELLTRNLIDYAVKVEPFFHYGPSHVTEQAGATFYVLTGYATRCRDILEEKGFKDGLVNESPETM